MNNEIEYIIRDNNGNFPWRLGLSLKENGKELCWDYVASKNINHGYLDKNRAISELEKMQELSAVAGFEGLTWELVCGNPKDFPWVKDGNIFLLEKDIPKGCVTKHRKATREIQKKYKAIFKEMDWRNGKAI